MHLGLEPMVVLWKGMLHSNLPDTPQFHQTWKKTTFLHKEGLSQNYYTQYRAINYNKSEFATKQRKVYLTTNMSKKGPPHN